MRWEKVQLRVKEKEASPEARRSAGRKGGVWGPGRRWGHTCNAIKGGRFLYVFGGYGKDNCQTNDVHVFDTYKQTWSKPMMKGVPPIPRDSHTCTTVGNNLVVFGGTDGANPLSDLHVLDTSTNTWISPTIRGKGPDAREGHSAALVGRRLFIFGGCGKSRDNPVEIYYNDLYILDTENLAWECAVTSGTPPSARDSHTCSSWRNKLIVLGGEDASDYYLSDVYILDTDTLVWTKLNTSGQMLAPRAGHTTVALGKNLFIFGGFTDDRTLYDDLHVLNVDTGIWSRVTNTNNGPSARFSAAGDCLYAQQGILVFIGGCNASLEALDDMYYLHTGMFVENERVQHRSEKMQKETKVKCEDNFMPKRGLEVHNELLKVGVLPTTSQQGMPIENESLQHGTEKLQKERKTKCEDNFMPVRLEVHSEFPKVGAMPTTTQEVTQTKGSPYNQEVSDNRTFEATITGVVKHGYTLQTTINGKRLQGMVFVHHPQTFDPANMKRRRNTDQRLKMDGGDHKEQMRNAEVNHVQDKSFILSPCVNARKESMSANAVKLSDLAHEDGVLTNNLKDVSK